MLKEKIREWTFWENTPDGKEKEAFEWYIFEKNIRGLHWMIPFVMVICVIMLVVNEIVYQRTDIYLLVSHIEYQLSDIFLLFGYGIMFVLFRHYKRDVKKNIRHIRVIQHFCYALVITWSISIILLDYRWSKSFNTTIFILVGFVLSFVYHAELKTIFWITMPNIVLLCYFILLKVQPKNYIFYFLVQQILLLIMFVNNYHSRWKEFVQQEKIRVKNEELLSMNNQLVLLRKESEEISHKKSQFLNAISHQLRTPLNAIMGTSELLGLKTSDPDTKEAVDTIQLAGNSLLSTILEFMNFNRLDISKFEINMASYDLAEWIDEIRGRAQALAKEKGIDFCMDISGESHVRLYGDRKRLTQVTMPLLENAIHFTEEGYVAVIVKIENESERTKINIKVMDTGVGMTKENLACFMNPFGCGKIKQEEDINETRNPQVEEVGMQYLIAKEIIHAMDGHIDFDTEAGRGSAFFFYVYQDREQDEMRVAQKENSYMGKRILLADDNTISRIIVKNILAAYNIEADYASDLDMCKEYLKYNQYHLIFMEQSFLKKKDKEMERLIKTQLSRTRILIPFVLFYSGEEKMKMEGYKVSYLEKPIRAEQFRAVLQMHLEE